MSRQNEITAVRKLLTSEIQDSAVAFTGNFIAV